MSCHSCEHDLSGTPWGQRSTLLWHHHVSKRQSCKLQLDWLKGSRQSRNCRSRLLWFTFTPFVSSCACYRPNNQNAIAMETQSSHTFPLFSCSDYILLLILYTHTRTRWCSCDFKGFPHQFVTLWRQALRQCHHAVSPLLSVHTGNHLCGFVFTYLALFF